MSYDLLNYYALGDSITAGVGSTSGKTSYADILKEKLKFKSFTKLGVSAATVMPSPGRYELATEVSAIGTGANIITVLIGVNDFFLNNPVGDVDAVLAKPFSSLDKTQSFSEAFRFCLETMKRDHEQARIYVILPLQTRLSAPSLDQYRAAEIRIANYLSIPVIYAHLESGLWAGGPFFPDGVHPNDTGYAILARYLERKLSGM